MPHAAALIKVKYRLVTQIRRVVRLSPAPGALRTHNTKKLRTHSSGPYMILLADSSMRARGARAQGHDDVAMKLLFWELEQHLKR